MPAHIKASLLGPSLTLPVSGGRLAIGTWQGIYLCEHRDHGGAALAGPDAERRVSAQANRVAERRCKSVSAGSRSPRSSARSTSTHGEPARLGQHAGLRLDDLRREHAAAVGLRRVQPDALEVARELLDRVDRPDALDLDRDPAVLVVAAHQVDRADVRRPLAPHEPEPLAAEVRRVGQRDLQVGLHAVLARAGRRRSPSRG